MRKIILFLLLGMLFLSSCSLSGSPFGRGSSYTEQNYFQGTEGLVMTFLEQAPPASVFENTPFDVQVLVQNKGAFDINDYRARFTLSFDTLEMIKQTTDSFDTILPETTYLQLYGKSPSYPNGELFYLFSDENPYFSQSGKRALMFTAQQLVANFEQNTATAFLTACYPYKTFFTDDVCIDTDPQNMDARRKVCSAEDTSYSKGQGAPLAVTAVETNMVPRGVYVLPQFVIHVEHKGNGMISNFNVQDTQCAPIQDEDVNAFEIKAQLGSDELVCLPEVVRLRDGKADVVCKLESNTISLASSNYYAPLIVEFSYLYTETISKEFSIRRTRPLNVKEEIPFDKDYCYPWETFVQGTPQGSCIPSCAYYAQQQNAEPFRSIAINDKTNNPQGHTWPIIRQGVSSEELITAWQTLNCVYGDETDCRRNPSTCIIAKDLCQPGTFCGWPKCFQNNQKPHAYVQPSATELIWHCSDADDGMNDPQRTCGCSDVAYWTFVEKRTFQTLVGENKAPSCDNLPDHLYTARPEQRVEGYFDNVISRMVFRTSMPIYDPLETSICVKVTDKQGNTAFQRIS